MNITEMANKQRPKSDSDTSAKVIAFYGGNILLLKNNDGTYELPGGHLKKGEATIVGAKREFKEETGLTVTRLGRISNKPRRVIFTGFLTTRRVVLSKEHIGFVFVPINKLNRYRLSHKARNDLRPFLNKKEKINNDNIQDIL